MRKGVSLLFSDVKGFLENSVNRVFMICICLCLLTIYNQYRTEKIIHQITENQSKNQKELITEIQTNRNKIHYRYFNLTRSLEDIHCVKINTRTGRIDKSIRIICYNSSNRVKNSSFLNGTTTL